MKNIFVLGRRNSGKSCLINILAQKEICHVSAVSSNNDIVEYDEIALNGDLYKITEFPGQHGLDTLQAKLSMHQQHSLTFCFYVVSALNAYDAGIWDMARSIEAQPATRMMIVISNIDKVNERDIVYSEVDQQLRSMSLEHIERIYVNLSESKSLNRFLEFVHEANAEDIQSIEATDLEAMKLSKNPGAGVLHDLDQMTPDLVGSTQESNSLFEQMVRDAYSNTLDDKIAELSNIPFCKKVFTTKTSAINWVDQVIQTLIDSDQRVIDLLKKHIVEGKDNELQALKRKLNKHQIMNNKTWYELVIPQDERVNERINSKINVSKLENQHNALKSSMLKEVMLISGIISWGKKVKRRILIGVPSILLAMFFLPKIFGFVNAFNEASPESTSTLEQAKNGISDILDQVDVMEPIKNAMSSSLGLAILALCTVVFGILLYEGAKKYADRAVSRKIESKVPAIRKNIGLKKDDTVRSVIAYTQNSLVETKEYYKSEYKSLFEELIN